jgi:hypothetical protein
VINVSCRTLERSAVLRIPLPVIRERRLLSATRRQFLCLASKLAIVKKIDSFSILC